MKIGVNINVIGITSELRTDENQTDLDENNKVVPRVETCLKPALLCKDVEE